MMNDNLIHDSLKKSPLLCEGNNVLEKCEGRLLNCSDSMDCLNSHSLMKSADGSSLKRKYDETDFFEEKLEKNSVNASFCVSPWEYRRLKADLMESQTQRIKLEDRIDQLHKKNKEAVIFFDKEKSEMKIQLESNRNAIKDLEFRLNKIRKREMECKEELNEKVKVFELVKVKLNEKIFKLKSENEALKLKIDKLELDYQGSMHKLNDEVNNLTEENKKLKLIVSEKIELCASLDAKLLSANEVVKKFEEVQHQLSIAQLKIKDLQGEKEDFLEAKNVTMALSEKVLRVPELEKELNEKKLQVANLKQFMHSNILLEEVVHDLKTKLAAIEGKENEIPNLRAKIELLELELEKWMSIATDYSTDSTRDSLRDYIESLQRKDLTNNMEINSLSAMVKSLENSSTLLQNELENFKVCNKKLETAVQKLRVEVQILRKKSILLSRERDSYRQQIDLYEKDLTLTGFHTESPSSDIICQMKNNMQNLEVSLEDYRKYIDTLEAHLQKYKLEEPSQTSETIEKLKEEIRNLEVSNKILSKIKDDLEEKLETRALKGEFRMPDIKVLHLRNNPISEVEKKQHHDVIALKEECEKLRARVKLLETGNVLNVTQRVNEALDNTQKVCELEKELQSVNLKMQRLKEVFKKTSQEFRDVSYMLLGYRIDLASSSKMYKLYNMYSSSPSDYLMFQQTKKGDMEMLGTTFAESMSKLVDEYLHKGNSIPAFLSAITLELYGSTLQSDTDDYDNNDNNDDENDNNDDYCDGGNANDCSQSYENHSKTIDGAVNNTNVLNVENAFRDKVGNILNQ